MRLFLTFAFAALLISTLPGPVSAQQTPANTVCNEQSGLSWDMNTEPNMDHYNVYVANQPGIETANPPVLPLVQVPHDPNNAVLDVDGNQVVEHFLNSLLSEGDKWFTVQAADNVGNLSGHSNEIGCAYDVSPDAPILKFLFVKPTS